MKGIKFLAKFMHGLSCDIVQQHILNAVFFSSTAYQVKGKFSFVCMQKEPDGYYEPYGKCVIRNIPALNVVWKVDPGYMKIKVGEVYTRPISFSIWGRTASPKAESLR